MKALWFLLSLAASLVLVQWILPWWSAMLVSALLAFAFNLPPWKTALIAALAGALIWGGYAAWLNVDNHGILAARMGELMGGLSVAAMVSATATLGGLAALLGALTGLFARRAFAPLRSIA